MLQVIFEFFEQTLQRLLGLFPESPFKDIIANIPHNDNLGYLNWFFPVSECLSVMSLWLIAIGIFYTWSAIARWIKIIGE